MRKPVPSTHGNVYFRLRFHKYLSVQCSGTSVDTASTPYGDEITK